MKKIFYIALSFCFLLSFESAAQRRQLKWSNVMLNGTPNTYAGWNAAGDAAELTGFTGSLASTQVAFGTAANTIGGENQLTYNSTNNLLSLSRADATRTLNFTAETTGPHIYKSKIALGANNFIIASGDGITGDVNGEPITIRAGNGLASGNSNGGELRLQGGSANGTGIAGNVLFNAFATDQRAIAYLNDNGPAVVKYPFQIFGAAGTTGVGTGVGMEFKSSTNASNFKVGATIEAVTTDVTAASEDFDLGFKTMSAGAAATEKLRITSDGRVYGTALHNNSGSVTGTTNQYIASGTYSPTIVLDANLDSSSGSLFTWTRVGNAVSVSGMLAADPTAATTVTSFRIPLPIASNFNASENCGGTGTYILTVAGTTVGAAIIRADATNDQAFVQFYPSSTSQVTMTFKFQYTVL